MRRHGASARMEVEFPSPGTAAVQVVAPGDGTGRDPAADRLDLMLGLLAWGIHRTDEAQVRGVADDIRAVATGIADAPTGAIAPGGLDVQLVRWSGVPGVARVAIELTTSVVGPVPVLRASPAPARVVLAGLCAALWEAHDSDAGGRLVIALALEGITAWYRDAHRLTPPRDAVRAARAHAADRLRAAGHVPPPCLDDGPG